MSLRFESKVAIVTARAASAPAGVTAGRSRCGWPRNARACWRWTATRRGWTRRSHAGAAREAIRPWSGDVTSSASLAAMAAECVAAFGRIDVLVNNVGGSAPGGPVEMDEAVWDLQVDTNLKSVFLACKPVLPTMLKQRCGAIFNIASTLGPRWTGSAQVAYTATKAGVIQLSRVVAVQHAAQGIRVNTVVLGQLHTPMVEARLAKQRAGGDVDALRAHASWCGSIRALWETVPPT